MRAISLAAAALALAAPAAAHASGGGGPSASFGGQGATNPKGAYSYIAVNAGNDSVIQRLHLESGQVQDWKTLRGQYGVPQVTYDGTKTGLSADGRTLVLSEILSSYPPRRSRLMVLDATSFKVEQRISLPGYYSVDAVSPDGRYVYLVHYVSPTRNPGAYEVVAYDRRNPGAPEVIMDPDEPDEEMVGSPISRVTSADGRMEFTLYDNPEEPFIHALDTEGHSAECIDLPQLKGKDLSSAKLALDGGTIAIGDLASLDPETQTVTLASAVSAPQPPPRARPTATPAPAKKDAGTSPWPIVAVGLAALGLLGLLLSRRRHSVHEVVDLHVAVDHPEQEPALRE